MNFLHQQKNPQNWSSANIDETYVHFKDNEKNNCL